MGERELNRRSLQRHTVRFAHAPDAACSRDDLGRRRSVTEIDEGRIGVRVSKNATVEHACRDHGHTALSCERKQFLAVEGIGKVTLQPINTEDGAPALIADAPVIRAFGMKSEHLAYAQGTSFADPELRSWESLGAGGIVPDLVQWAS